MPTPSHLEPNFYLCFVCEQSTTTLLLLRCAVFRYDLTIHFAGNYSCLKVDLIFTRDRAFYFTTVFIPGIILVTSSFITFWLEWNAVPARSMIGKLGWRLGLAYYIFFSVSLYFFLFVDVAGAVNTTRYNITFAGSALLAL